MTCTSRCATIVIGALAVIGASSDASAQRLPDWAENAFGMPGHGQRRAPSTWGAPVPPQRSWWQDEPFWPGYDRRRFPDEHRRAPELMDGGPRPEIAPREPPIVAFTASFEPHSIVIDVGARKLYFVLPQSRAYAYDISVGREGFSWTGTETVSRKQEWPDWHPPAEMRERDPSLPVKMTGGIRNPLGAMALYLGNTLYRIHGTNDERSIGRAESSGCFRMMNASVLHLASITPIGTKVTVVPSLGGGAAAVASAGGGLRAEPLPPASPQPSYSRPVYRPPAYAPRTYAPPAYDRYGRYDPYPPTWRMRQPRGLWPYW